MNETTMLLPHIKLRFNVEHPSLEECYAYGYECALSEVGEEENPYRDGTIEKEHWEEGWWAGFYGEKPLYDLMENPQQTEKELTAANDQSYHFSKIISDEFITKIYRITGVIAATAMLGYQVLDLVA